MISGVARGVMDTPWRGRPATPGALARALRAGNANANQALRAGSSTSHAGQGVDLSLNIRPVMLATGCHYPTAGGGRRDRVFLNTAARRPDPPGGTSHCSAFHTDEHGPSLQPQSPG